MGRHSGGRLPWWRRIPPAWRATVYAASVLVTGTAVALGLIDADLETQILHHVTAGLDAAAGLLALLNLDRTGAGDE